MKRNILLIALFLVLNKPGFSQFKELPTSVKLYFNFYHLNQNSAVGDRSGVSYYRNNVSTLNFLSPSVQWYRDNGSFHEWELSNLSFERTDNKSSRTDTSGQTTVHQGGDLRSFAVSVKYEYAFNLLPKKSKSLVTPYIGLAVSPYYSSYDFVPFVSNSFPVSEVKGGLRIQFVPRVIMNINERCYMDISVPINFNETEFSKTRIENPSFTFSQQSQSVLSFDMFPSGQQIKLGFAVKL